MRIRAAVFATLAVFILACGGSSTSAKTSLDPKELLAASAAASRKVSSFHFHLTHENGATPMPLNLQLVEAEGDVALPDKLAADLKAKAGTINASVKVIAIGDKTWITNPFSRRWQVLPGASIKDIADPRALVDALLAAMKDPKSGSEATIDGVKTLEVSGNLDAGELQAGLPSAAPGHPVSVDIWIGEKDSLPRRARIAGRLSDNEPEKIVRQIDLTRFNATVEIQPPPE